MLVVDEISSSGETLRLVLDELVHMGAGEARCAVMYAHSWSALSPDYIGLVSDALLINPWDREIVEDGHIVFHPEYVYALELQNIPPESVLPMSDMSVHTPEKQR